MFDKMEKIIFASDFAPIRKFAPVMKSEPAKIYGDLLPVLQSADYSIVNLESPLDSPDGLIAKSGAAFSGELSHVSALTAGNFRAAILANNHTFDSNISGFVNTAKVLADNHISVVGAGKDIFEARKPLTFTLHGKKIALFAIAEGEDMWGAAPGKYGVRPWEVELLADEIRAARREFDIILVSAHCGLEYQPFPSFYVYEAFELWAQAGADMIIGHHPHVPQGMTFFGKTPAYFSLGNFVFYQPNKLLHRKTGYFLEIGIDDDGICFHRAVPYRITDGGLRLLNEREQADFQKLFAELSAPLQNKDSAEKAWHAVLAYNGIAGFQDELRRILAVLESDPVKGAAMLRNRVTCIQHRSQWIDGTSRIVNGEISDAPAELTAMVKRFMTEEVDS